MKVIVRIPKRQELELTGRRKVQDILRELNMNPETVLVIRGATLLTRDMYVDDTDEIEIRPAISGGEA